MSDSDNEDTKSIVDKITSTRQQLDEPTPIIPGDVNDTPPDEELAHPQSIGDNADIINDIANKINDAHNILVALSSDPSVDELAAAIGISLALDRMEKRATAIYSGTTPNALQFLKPEETLDTKPEILQDFVIALNKEKADHLRYKIDGDYVKIFITPYRVPLKQDDLEFSYGDFNVDLVIALNVANGIDLDDALREHGRIMHDATVINVTTGKPGKLGEIEWSNRMASSVSEMVAELLFSMTKLEAEESTAFLTGIVAATDRFANAHTTANSLEIASRLIDSGANQQLIAKNIVSNNEKDDINSSHSETHKSSNNDKDGEENEEVKPEDASLLDIQHDEEPAEDKDNKEEKDASSEASNDIKPDDVNGPFSSDEEETNGPINKEDDKSISSEEMNGPFSSDDVNGPISSDEEKTNAPVSSDNNETTGPISGDNQSEATVGPTDGSAQTESGPALLDDLKAAEASLANAGAEVTPDNSRNPININNGFSPTTPPEEKSETTIAPPSDFATDSLTEGTNKYGKMLEEALAESNNQNNPMAPAPDAYSNPAMSSAPPVASAPEVNGVPDINYMPLPGDEILPPPPTPPVDFSSMPAAPTMPSASPIPTPPELGNQPAMQDQVYRPPVANPGAFNIPGR